MNRQVKQLAELRSLGVGVASRAFSQALAENPFAPQDL